MKSEQIKEITDRAAERLVAALQAGHSEALTAYLKAIGRFHRYSLHNVLPIASQKPSASYVAGFRTWNELGRFVKKGEKGIMILAPIVRRKTDDVAELEETSRPIFGFRAAYVFDISQTDGKELPQIGLVEGDPRDCGDKLRRFASAQGISVEYFKEIAPARGMSCGGRITLLPDQSPAEEFSTLAHELAHELLHRGDRRSSTSERVRETEAEATALVVCQAVGLETGSAASDYIQLWNGDIQLLTESLGYIRQAASQIIGALTDTLAPPALILPGTGHPQNCPNALPLKDIARRTARPFQPLGEFDDFYLMHDRNFRNGDLNNVVSLRKAVNPTVSRHLDFATRACIYILAGPNGARTRPGILGEGLDFRRRSCERCGG